MEYTNCLACSTIIIALLMIVINEALPYEDKRKPLQPSFKPTPTNITVHKGELVVLKCHIVDVGPRVVVWRRQDHPVPLTIGEEPFRQEDNIDIEVERISDEESHWDLIIKDVKLSHAGMYLCQVTATKLYTHYITLTVLDEPMRPGPDIHIDGSVYVDKGDQIHLKCNATDVTRAPDNIEWYFKGEKIVESLPRWRERTQILRQQRKNTRSYLSDLIIDSAGLRDAGNYVCRSSDLRVSYITVHVLDSRATRRQIATDKNSQKRDGVPRGTSSNLESSAVSVFGRYSPPLFVLISFLSIFYVLDYSEVDVILYVLNTVTFLPRLRPTST